MTATIRWSAIGMAAILLVVSAGGCASQKLETERSQLLQQNAQLQQQLSQTKASLSAAQTQLQQQQAATAAAQAQAMQAQQAAQSQPAPAAGYTSVMPTFKGGKGTVHRTSVAMRGPHHAAGRRSVNRRREVRRFVLSSDLLFASGSARLSPRATHALLHVVYLIKRHYAGRYIRVEGFTDNRPIHRVFRNNYELGLARARAVENFLARHGISRHWLRAISYGSHDLVSRTNLALDRRVEIVILR